MMPIILKAILFYIILYYCYKLSVILFDIRAESNSSLCIKLMYLYYRFNSNIVAANSNFKPEHMPQNSRMKIANISFQNCSII